jgi:parallel beta-helix repeat protein
VSEYYRLFQTWFKTLGNRRRLVVAVAAMIIVSACSGSGAPDERASLPPTTTVETSPTTTDAASIEDQEPEDGTVRLGVGDDFAALVASAPEQTTFIIEPGVHRLHEIQPKDGMTFLGGPGSVLSGAIELGGWTSVGASAWQFDGLEMSGLEHGVCIDNYEGCTFSQDLYMDDIMLWQVTDIEDLGPGRWYWEGQRILVSDDPVLRHVELSVATHAFSSAADDVTIRGLVVEKYATPAQLGAVQSTLSDETSPGRNWLIEDSEIRLNHGAGIRAGEETTLRRVSIHHNGQLGIAFSGGSGGLIEDCEIASNNIAGFEWGWEAGGAKFTETDGLVVRGCDVHDNTGPGLWTDISNSDTLYESNTVTNNTGPGIFHEISYDAVIRDNTVAGNGFGFAEWLWGSGILVAASTDVEIYGNTVTGNADGIGGIQQVRDDGPGAPYLLARMHVHDNTISMESGQTGVVEDVGDPSVFLDRDIRFDSNTYVDTDGLRYSWLGKKLDAKEWQGEGQDLDGTWR